MVRLDTLVAVILADARRRMEKDAGADGAAPAPTRQQGGVARGKGLGCDVGRGGATALHHRGEKARDTRRPSGGLGK